MIDEEFASFYCANMIKTPGERCMSNVTTEIRKKDNGWGKRKIKIKVVRSKENKLEGKMILWKREVKGKKGKKGIKKVHSENCCESKKELDGERLQLTLGDV